MAEDNEEDPQLAFKWQGYTLRSGPDTMRQPTNLELAQFIYLQTQYQTAMILLMNVERDILSDEEDYVNAIAAFNQAAQAVNQFWIGLLKDGMFPDE